MFPKPKKPPTTRRTWRITPDAPAGQFVDFDPTEVASACELPSPPPKVLEPAIVPDWRGSSFDLLNGVEVEDQSDSIPGELFEKLFNQR